MELADEVKGVELKGEVWGRSRGGGGLRFG